MKLLISNQHGAIVMALLPFIYGMLLNQPIWLHLPLLLAWFSLYLMTYPFLALFKGRNLTLYRKWTLIYAVSTLIFSLPALFYNPTLLYFVLAIIPFSLVNIYYTKNKNERALCNDLAAIVIFALAGMAAYYFPNRLFDYQIWLVAILPSLFFIGTTLYVKSVLRERKNPIYYRTSVLFHLCCVVVSFVLFSFIPYADPLWLSASYLPALLRAIWLSRCKLSVKQVGLIEFAISFVFLLGVLYATMT